MLLPAFAGAGALLALGATFGGSGAADPPPPGLEAPDFRVEKWIEGPPGASSLSDLRGRVVLIDFWRTW